jgi:hypothetical protein
MWRGRPMRCLTAYRIGPQRSGHRFQSGFAVLFLLTFIWAIAPAAWAQTTITVTSTSDPSAAGACTLRDAIGIAQGGSAAGDDTCTPTGSGTPYTIQFGVTGTIALRSALPTITSSNLTIMGPGGSPGITIDGGGTVQFDASCLGRCAQPAISYFGQRVGRVAHRRRYS